MIFDALSNAAYRVSLRGPGAEIEGGLLNNPPAGGGKSRGPAGRGLKCIQGPEQLNICYIGTYLSILHNPRENQNNPRNICSDDGLKHDPFLIPTSARPDTLTIHEVTRALNSERSFLQRPVSDCWTNGSERCVRARRRQTDRARPCCRQRRIRRYS